MGWTYAAMIGTAMIELAHFHGMNACKNVKIKVC
jgi:hypothetical protein